MKRYFALMVLAVAFVLPSVVSAQSITAAPQSCLVLNTSSLWRGNTQPNVLLKGQIIALQKFLALNGYLSANATGYYGEQTANAVKAFQKANGLTQTGSIGPLTSAKIKALTCDVSTAIQTGTIPVATIGCPAGAMFNSQTGASCTDSQTTVLGCPVGAMFNYLTGAQCTTVEPTQPSITVISPNGGGYWYRGQNVEVKWSTMNIPASNNMTLRLRSYNTGVEYNLIGYTTNDGSEIITVPSTLPIDSYKFEVKTSVGGTSYIDASDSYFKVTDQTQGLPTVTVSGTPTLSLSYDSSKNESSLMANAYVYVTAGATEAKVLANQGSLAINDINGNQVIVDSTQTTLVSIGELRKYSDQYGQSYYSIPAGSSSKFSLKTTSNPQQMFAGTYTASVTSLDTVDRRLTVPANSSSQVTIVGEKAPYITSVTSTVKSGDVFKIIGVRLYSQNYGGLQVYIDGVATIVQYNLASDSTSLTFTVPTSWSAGQHNLQVGNNRGMSNRVGFTVTTQTSTTQTIPIKSIFLDESNNVHFLFSQMASACLQLKNSQGIYFALSSAYPTYSCANTTLFNGYQTELLVPRDYFAKTISVGDSYQVCNADTRGNSYNACSSLIVVSASPIIITDVQYSPSAPKVNEMVTATVNIKNNSSLDYNIPFKVNASGSTITVNSLGAGTSKIVSITAFSFGTPGTYPVATNIIYPLPGFPDQGSVGQSFTKNITFTSITPTTPTITCSASPSPAVVGQQVTWFANSSGGGAFKWTASVTGSAPQVSTTYTTTGQKNAIVLFTPADGGTPVAASCWVTVNAATQPVTPSITVTSPNGGESWTQGTVHNITWTAPGLSTVSIYLLKDRTNVATIASNVSASSGSYPWTVSNNYVGTGFQIYIASAGVLPDDSNATFTISAPTVSAPNIFAMVSSNSPAARYITTTPNQSIQGIVFGVIGLKSTNKASVLNAFRIHVNAPSGVNVSTIYSNAKLISGSNTYNGTLASDGTMSFSGMSIPLAQDVWQDLTIKVDVAPAVTMESSLNLKANIENIVATDASGIKATIDPANLTTNTLNFMNLSLSVSNTSSNHTAIEKPTGNPNVYAVNYSFVLTNPGNADLYVSAIPSTFLSQTVIGSTLSQSSITLISASPSVYAGDRSGVAYVIPAGSSRSFSAYGAISGTIDGNITLKITGINYGTGITAGSASGQNAQYSITTGLENLSQTVIVSAPVPVAQTISVTSPQSGDVWQKGSTYTVRWTANTPTVMVDLVRPGFEYHLTAPNGDITNTGSLTFTVPTTLAAANDYQVKVMYRVSAVPKVTAYSSNFTIGTIVVTPPTPTISSIYPTTGAVGTAVIVTGTGFASTGNTVKFSTGSISNISSMNGTSLTFNVPSISVGTYNVSVVSNDKLSNTATFVVPAPATPTPTINSIFPTSGPVGTLVTITGTGFTTTDNVINFGSGVVANTVGLTSSMLFNSSNGTSISFRIPASVAPACRYSTPACALALPSISLGTYGVSVTANSKTSNSFNFTVANATNLGNTLSASAINSVLGQNAVATSVGSSPVAQNVSSCVELNSNLQYRDNNILSGGEVSLLQDFLNSKGYLSAESTGYFGDQTFAAVKSFQMENGVEGTGYVGSLTRAKIKEISCK